MQITPYAVPNPPVNYPTKATALFAAANRITKTSNTFTQLQGNWIQLWHDAWGSPLGSNGQPVYTPQDYFDKLGTEAVASLQQHHAFAQFLESVSPGLCRILLQSDILNVNVQYNSDGTPIPPKTITPVLANGVPTGAVTISG